MAGAVTRAQARPVRKMVFVDGLCHKDTGETCLRILSLRKNMHTHCKRLKVDAATSTAKAWARLPNFPLTCDESSSDPQMSRTINFVLSDHANGYPPFPPETPSTCFSALPEAE